MSEIQRCDRCGGVLNGGESSFEGVVARCTCPKSKPRYQGRVRRAAATNELLLDVEAMSEAEARDLLSHG